MLPQMAKPASKMEELAAGLKDAWEAEKRTRRGFSTEPRPQVRGPV